jgi:uncharacterized protein YcnI
MKSWFAALLVVFGTVSISAHIMVSPPQSKVGVSQRYELRVHNESKVAVAAVELEIPGGITVTEIGHAPSGTVTTTKAGDRITAIKWQVEVAPSKYFALPFTATNPGTATDVHWNVREHLSDGSVGEWSDKPNAAEKASVTTIGCAAAGSLRPVNDQLSEEAL